IEALGVHTLVTACANCRILIEEGLDHYRVQVDMVGLTEMVAQQLDESATRVRVGGES
ncbi:MAG: hypothetical protein HQM00_06190, partial [Magnetococcales bacterium]|nr:hypothetical protein [Magnetococcales bacterium]